MIRILLADAHAIVRRGLRQIVAEAADLAVVGEATNTEEMFACARTPPCDVVVTGISMFGRSGLDAFKALRQGHPTLPVLVLSLHPEDQEGLRALQLGAAGYMTIASPPEEVVTAIRKVGTGGKYISPALAEQLAVHLATNTQPPLHATLSQREHRVLCRIAAGKSVAEIAGELALSVKTVNTYRVRILEKLALRKTAELMYYGIRHRLVEPPRETPSRSGHLPSARSPGTRSS